MAVVGETGSGKSTLAALLVRLADLTVGRVLIDGIDVRDLAASDSSRTTGMVTQETYLAHATIAANLRAGRAGCRPTRNCGPRWRRPRWTM